MSYVDLDGTYDYTEYYVLSSDQTVSTLDVYGATLELTTGSRPTELTVTGALTLEAGTLVYGTLTAEVGFTIDDGFEVEDGGTLDNQGTVTIVGATLLVQNDGILENEASGTITLAYGSSGSLASYGAITENGGDNPYAGGLFNAGLIILQGNSSSNSLYAPNIELDQISNSGTIDAVGGYVVVEARESITGSNGLTGTLAIGAGATLELGGPVSGNTVLFDSGGSGKLILDSVPQQQNFSAAIAGFTATDQIEIYTDTGAYNEITNVNPTDVTSSETTLALDDVTTLVGELSLLGNYTGWTFNAAAGFGEDTITAMPCYCRGTLILTDRGEVTVEELAIGDRVITASGVLRPIKWIGRRSFAGRFVLGRKDILPICISAGALDDNVPKRDLWISPHHAMYFDGVLIEAKDLVDGVSVIQADIVEKVEYFHIELDTHDLIVAEGALSETFVDHDSRPMFHNADEYYMLYPEDAAAGAAYYCAPRLDDGFRVEEIRRRIAARAGSRSASAWPEACIAGLRFRN